jgi:demethylmenaquinone methyltransferase / 2-methoxy-6-polyprenyl-1,4-benzoquinol methylase
MKAYEAYNNRLFARWAPIYDGFELVLSGVRRKIALAIDPTDKSVLDVATGTGSLAIALSPKAKKVVGIDLSDKMLAVARKKTHTGDLTFLQMDASRMDFSDGAFDMVTISLGLHDMPLEVRTLVMQEAKRVLKKDGKLYILEYDLPPHRLLGRITYRLINLFESNHYKGFMASDLEQYLRSFGFRVERKSTHLLGHLQFLTLSQTTVASPT